MSSIWRFFEKRNGDAKCLLCQQVCLMKSANTTGLWRHLEIKHAQEYASLKAKPASTTCTALTGCASSSAASVSSGSQVSVLKQCSLSSFLQSAVKKLPQGHSESLRIDKLIVEMIAVDGQPWTVVADAGFRRLMSAVAPQYELKSDKFYRDRLDDLYTSVHSEVERLVSKLDTVAITSDIWSDKGVSLLSLTVHGVDASMDRFNTLIAARVLETSHTAANIAEKLSAVLDEWQLQGKISAAVTDHARNIQNAINQLSVKNVGCSAHKLNLIVQECLRAQPAVQHLLGKCRSTVGHFHHSSTAQAELKRLQVALGLPVHKLIMEIVTRWNSTLHMLQRVDEQMAAIVAYAVGKNDFDKFSATEQKLLKRLIQVLEIFDELTNEVSKSDTSISFIIPMKSIMLKYLDSVFTEGSGLSLVHEKLQNEITKRFSGFEKDTLLTTATALDPRFKLNFFEQPAEAKELAIRTIEDMLQDETESDDWDSVSTTAESSITIAATQICADDDGAYLQPPRKKLRLAEIHNSFQTAFEDNHVTPTAVSKMLRIKPSLNAFFAQKLESTSCDPLKFWKDVGEELRPLQSIVRKLFGIPASSVASERVFSTAGNIFSDQRASLRPNNLEKLLFCKVNLPMINFKY